jgi:hypothetical protein
MKFQQLPEGQRFEFEGEIYTKVDQLKARHARSGRHRVIRRSATVKSLAVAIPTDTVTQACRLPVADISAAFEVFYRRCRQCLEELAVRPDTRSLETAYGDLESARQRFLDTLGLGP